MSSANGILILSENQKQLIFDYNHCMAETPASDLVITIYDNFTDTQKQFLYDNGFRINSVKAINKDLTVNSFTMSDASIAFSNIIMFSIDSFDGIDSCGDFIIDIYMNSLCILKLYIANESIPNYKIYDKQCNAISANMESFMLLRTNPKLTGNIKLVVTDDYKLYLDTFKVSTTSILNKHIYRHKGIPADGNYPYDVYNVFKSVPADEMYRVYDDSYNPHKNYYDSNLQVENIYEYGAEFNDDKLYDENMRILAPLYIGKNLPDYFIIFRTDHLVNDNQYDNMDVFDMMLKEAECVKIFDLRKNTTIGKYLNNYKDMVTKYLAGTCSLQFIEQDNDVSSGNYRQGRNVWKGISFKKGILTDMAETSYFANQILSDNVQVQEKFNMFLLNGYSRNNILYPNILNLQFMFNDDAAENLTLHNYFGLYLTENDFMTFNQVIKMNDDGGNTKMTYYDESDNIVNINDTKIKILDDAKYKNRIFFGTTVNDAVYMKSRNDFNIFMNEYVMNKPYNNVVHLHCEKINAYDSFMTLIFNNQIHYGEHFKFIYINGDDTAVYELVASNDESLSGYKDCISPYVQTNNINGVNIYRITFYTQDKDDVTIQASLSDQIYRMQKAICRFNECIYCTNFNDNTLAVISDMQHMYFQHILYDNVTYDSKTDYIQYFNYGNFYECHILSDMPAEYDVMHKAFCNNGFENGGIRYSNIVKFIDLCDYKHQNIYEVDGNIYKNLENISAPLINTGTGYYPMTHISISKTDLEFNGMYMSSAVSDTVSNMNCVVSPYDCGHSIVIFQYDAFTNNGYINICSPLQSNIALMGISSVKDIDMLVNVGNIIHNETSKSASFTAGETVNITGTDHRLKRYVTYKLLKGHILGLPINVSDLFMISFDKIYYTFNGIVDEYAIQTDYLTFDIASVIETAYNGQMDTYSYNVSEPVMAEANFYVDPQNTSTSKLEMPLVPLVNCQWKSNGIYFDTLPLLNTDTFANYQVAGNFIENIYTPSANKQYISGKLSDAVNIDGGKNTIRDFIKYGNYKNAIKKYLTDKSKIDTAIGYYNSYVDSLEFIYYGIKFIFKMSNSEYSNEIKLSEYNNYEVFIINDYNSLENNEIYISKNEEFILVINHAYKMADSYANGNIKMLNATIADADYNWYKAGFNYDLLHTSTINNVMRIQKSNKYVTQDMDGAKYIVETDLRQYEDFDDDDVYFVSDTSGYAAYSNYDEYQQVNGKYGFIINDVSDNTIIRHSDVSVIYDRYAGTAIDSRSKNAYVVKMNDTSLQTKTYADKLESYMESFNADFDLMIINGDECIEYAINDSYRPLTINMQKPNQIKFNQGLFDPAFNDIFVFDENDEISDILGIDTLYANTHVSNINSIKNMYYNKVMNAGMKCIYNYFCKSDYSPLTTDWDNDLYRLYDDDVKYNDTAGYILGITDKMMFGSKCLVMHDGYITVCNWAFQGNSNNAVFTVSSNNVNGIAKNNLQIVLDITDSFINALMDDKAFVNNWNNIGNISNRLVYINNYINNTMMKLYDVKNPEISLYGKYEQALSNSRKPSDYFVKKDISSQMDGFLLINNINTKLYNQNNKVILSISIQDYENTLFYPVIKINKI